MRHRRLRLPPTGPVELCALFVESSGAVAAEERMPCWERGAVDEGPLPLGGPGDSDSYSDVRDDVRFAGRGPAVISRPSCPNSEEKTPPGWRNDGVTSAHPDHPDMNDGAARNVTHEPHTPDPVAGRPGDDVVSGLPPPVLSPTGRQAYCSTACRKTAFRRRHQQGGPAVTVPTAGPRREITVDECPDCGERLLGEQRCDTCHTFARRIGIGGPCPNCDQPLAITELIDQATSPSPTGKPTWGRRKALRRSVARRQGPLARRF